MLFVLDASAALAALREETGADRVAEALPSSVISSVNWSEIVGELRRRNHPLPQISRILSAINVPVVAADETLAVMAGDLRPITDAAGLSLGDRFCLALAKRYGARALTSDRSWLRIADIVGVDVDLIR